ncbi:MAG: GNAT family N-acetyltransferase [Nocardioides sp.]
MPFLRDWHEEPFALGSPHGFPATSGMVVDPTGELRARGLAAGPRGPSRGRAGRVQDLHAQDFAQTRHVETGSWLGGAHQGVGTGTLMRQLVVGFAFDELVETCGSGYLAGNHASAAVSRKVGYVDNGRQRIVQHTRAGKTGVDEQRVVVTPARSFAQSMRSPWRAPIARRFLGIDSILPAPPGVRDAGSELAADLVALAEPASRSGSERAGAGTTWHGGGYCRYAHSNDRQRRGRAAHEVGRHRARSDDSSTRTSSVGSGRAATSARPDAGDHDFRHRRRLRTW